MLKLLAVRVARMIGPKIECVRTIGLPDINLPVLRNGEIEQVQHAQTFDELKLIPYPWQASIARWVISNHPMSRIKWNELPPYETADENLPVDALVKKELASSIYRDELLSEIDNMTSSWGVRYYSWSIGDYNPKYYAKLAAEVKKLLCFKNPLSEKAYLKRFEGGTPVQVSGVPTL